jgi:hypothetical protein
MIFGIFIVIFIIEIILSLSWSKLYFKYGILVYKKSFKSNSKDIVFPSAEILNESFVSTWKPSIVFSNLGNNELAIREKLFEIKVAGYSPFIRGHLEFNKYKKEVTLKCYLNYTVSLLMAFLIFSVFKDFDVNIFNSATPFLDALILITFFIFGGVICGGITAYQIQQYKVIPEEILNTTRHSSGPANSAGP